jgi:hypothetical protein
MKECDRENLDSCHEKASAGTANFDVRHLLALGERSVALPQAPLPNYLDLPSPYAGGQYAVKAQSEAIAAQQAPKGHFSTMAGLDGDSNSLSFQDIYRGFTDMKGGDSLIDRDEWTRFFAAQGLKNPADRFDRLASQDGDPKTASISDFYNAYKAMAGNDNVVKWDEWLNYMTKDAPPAGSGGGAGGQSQDAQAIAGIAGQWKKHFDSNFAEDPSMSQFFNGSDQFGNRSYPGNGEKQLDSPDNTKVTIVTDPVTGKKITVADQFVTRDANGQIYSGMITTKDTLPADGLFVARMKLSDTGGTWPAFWAWRTGREIDVMEGLRNGEHGTGSHADDYNYHFNTHDWGPGNAHTAQGGWADVKDIMDKEPLTLDGNKQTLTNSFHNYAVAVHGNETTYYFDGHVIGKATDKFGGQSLNWLLNTAVGGNWGGLDHINDGPFGPEHGTQIEYFKMFQSE